jgi:ribose 5-phosphate isomerase A
MNQDSWKDLKYAAGTYAAEWVLDGMVVGLGSGSTARYTTLRIAERLREGSLTNIVAVPTSNETAALARRHGISVVMLGTLYERLGEFTDNGEPPPDGRVIDLTIDGADEVDPHLNAIKGIGGFLLREKIVASVTRREVLVVDETKLVSNLGATSPVPVEVARFGWQSIRVALERTGAKTALRQRDGRPYLTDEGHYIIDCRYGEISSPHELATTLQAIPGVVGHGLFLGMVHSVVVANRDGVYTIER